MKDMQIEKHKDGTLHGEERLKVWIRAPV
jgi:hypothetical protein